MTWAFVGRWWEAPPWPLALNAKQRCHCLTSAAADACAGCFSGNQEQKQTAPLPQHCTHTCKHRGSEKQGGEDLTKAHANILQVGIPIQQQPRPDVCNMLPQSLPLRSTESERSDKWRHSEGLSSYRYENAVQCRLKLGPGSIRGVLEITQRSQDKANWCHFPANSLI